jgi:hypothetical protein
MTKIETKQERDEVKIQFLISSLSGMGQEVISRREPEFMFTAAYIAAAGAVAWGVAAIDVSDTVYLLLNPAIVGAIGVVFIGFFVVAKIIREYCQYVGARKEQGRIAKDIILLLNENEALLPKGLKDPKPQKGHLFSIGIVIAAMIASAWFCYSVYLN